MDTMYLNTPAQIKALAHPLRLRIVEALGQDRMTNQQLADALGEPASKTHFHVLELSRAGLINLAAQTPKGGVLEKYYRAAAQRFQLGPKLGRQGNARIIEASLDATRAAFADMPAASRAKADVHVVQERTTVDRATLGRITAHLQAITEELARHQDAADQVDISVTAILHTVPTRATDAQHRDGER
jgi:DNA-binding transcriptional ArsR family regulator